MLEFSFLKELIVKVMPSWEDWISMAVPFGHKHHLLILFSLFFNISPFCGLPSRSKKEIVEEVMQRRVSWFDNIHPKGTFDDFIKIHGWFSLSPDKNTLLVVAFMCGF